MSRTVAALGAALLLVCAAPAQAQCTKDTDCKGDRICSDGTCVAPGSGSGPGAAEPLPPISAPEPTASGYEQPAPPPPPPAAGQPAAPGPELPLTWPTFYGSLGIPLTFHGWGSITASGLSGDADLEAYLLAGLQLSGYYATKILHIGGYFIFQAGEGCVETNFGCVDGDFTFISLGAAMKVGTTVGQRLWMGAAMDLGVAFWDPEGRDNGFTGLLLFPRFHVDFLLLNAQGFKMTVFGALGTQIHPVLASEVNNIDFTAWAISLTMILGASFGG